ncbi:MAG: extracellular solute-binding protein [Gemmatimonadetes bacterium]|nr:extracellular solute-binding protein [Gemmatimonadota bacterium]
MGLTYIQASRSSGRFRKGFRAYSGSSRTSSPSAAPICSSPFRRLMPRRPIATLVRLLLLASVCACGDAGGDPLIVYTPHGADLLEHFAAQFEAVHPEITVQWLDMGSQEVLDRLRSERANPQADVWWGAPAEIFGQGAEEELLEPFRPSWADQLPPEARGPDDLWFGTYLTPEVIAFNSAVVPPSEAPQDWDEVLDPRWRGEVLIRDPLASGTMRAIFAALIYRESEGTGNPEAGYEWLLRLDAQTKEYVLNPTLLYQKLARQEGLVTLWAMPDIETLRATTDYPIDYVIPAGGTPVVMDGIAVVRGARHPELAREFVEFVGTEEALVESAELFFRIPARTDVDPERLPAWLREALPRIHPMELNAEVVGDRTPEWMRYWDSNIRRRGEALGYE